LEPSLIKKSIVLKERKIREEEYLHDPVRQFRLWFGEAEKARVPEHHAMALATVDSKGHPSLRMVLLKGFDEKGFVFFTNYESRKGIQLSSNPNAAITFHWKELEKQIRIEGKVKRVTFRESDEYFHSRPFESRINACISPQSCIIPDRDFLEVMRESFIHDLQGNSPSRPKNWGGYRLSPVMIEFWQGRPHRLHDRIRYTLYKKSWTHVRLAP
jgi:pyridoxamine 5'-phosphate oxidase